MDDSAASVAAPATPQLAGAYQEDWGRRSGSAFYFVRKDCVIEKSLRSWEWTARWVAGGLN
jgi:hypothetical protein